MAQNGHYLSVDCKPGRGGCAMDESQACIAVAAMPTACQTLNDSPPFLTKKISRSMWLASRSSGQTSMSPQGLV